MLKDVISAGSGEAAPLSAQQASPLKDMNTGRLEHERP